MKRGEKRKVGLSDGPKAKRQKSSVVEEVESDVFIAGVSRKMLQFSPLSKEVSQSLSVNCVKSVSS